jgi:hypothetical protein
MRRVLAFFCIVLWLVAGCGGSSKREAYSPPGSQSAAKSAQYPGAPPADYGPESTAGATDSAPTPSAAAPESARTESAPRERPGLGTEWGETRASHVRNVTFARADADRPFAVAQLHYNDRRGARAMAAFTQGQGHHRELTAAGGAITVSIHDENDEPLEAIQSGNRTLVIGEAGQRYSIVITNHTGHRFEAVGTVDGLDVINGQPAHMQNRGYILMPFGTVTIDGFRQSQNAVAAFRFASVADSYAAQTGSARNVGVIGVAFFAESGDSFEPYSERELRMRDTANPFPGEGPRFARPPSR